MKKHLSLLAAGLVIGAGALLWSTVLERVAEVAGVTEAWASEHDILDGIVLSLRS